RSTSTTRRSPSPRTGKSRNDGSELLTEDTIDATFSRGDGDLWTAQRSVDKGEPEETAVESMTYAGR
ncbi:hypothetical protein, partial [Brachybacterium tyrofermentans]